MVITGIGMVGTAIGTFSCDAAIMEGSDIGEQFVSGFQKLTEATD